MSRSSFQYLCTCPSKLWSSAKFTSSTKIDIYSTRRRPNTPCVAQLTSTKTWAKFNTCSLIRPVLWRKTKWCSRNVRFKGNALNSPRVYVLVFLLMWLLDPFNPTVCVQLPVLSEVLWFHSLLVLSVVCFDILTCFCLFPQLALC